MRNPEANEVVIVQNMTPIGSAEEYDALFPSGYPSADKPLSAGNEGESTDEAQPGKRPFAARALLRQAMPRRCPR